MNLCNGKLLNFYCACGEIVGSNSVLNKIYHVSNNSSSLFRCKKMTATKFLKIL